MKSTPDNDNYPLFEANQVLLSEHLNQSFNYLDEQERLTRANLIGIGIVCGLEIGIDAGGSVSIGKGCGITSEGYLVVEPEAVTLTHHKPYTPPDRPEYAPFLQEGVLHQMSELLTEEEPGSTALKDDPGFLENMVVLLFLELKQGSLRSCSLSDCDDRGSQVKVSVRRLVIKDEVAKLLMDGSGSESTPDPYASLMERLKLPELRLPRYRLSAGATTEEVLAAFHAVFSGAPAAELLQALRDAYRAFLPLVQERYPSDPFDDFQQSFALPEAALKDAGQVLFLQYYCDLFHDLVAGYNELWGRGVELLCICSPSENLFRRHLLLGRLKGNEGEDASTLRHRFLPSPAGTECDARTQEVKQLFDRLVEMTRAFADDPGGDRVLSIRVTPSRVGAPLSEKSIPYYYLQKGTPPLYRLWNPMRSRLKRSHHNPGYRAGEYTSPAAPPFIREPLRFDLEPYNFLRIEGHLGQRYDKVLKVLGSMKSEYRLPIEIIAVRTGAFDEKVVENLSDNGCHFQDLESLYATMREELVCLLGRDVQYFYSLPDPSLKKKVRSRVAVEVKKVQIPLLMETIPSMAVGHGTMGRIFEEWLSSGTNNGMFLEANNNIVYLIMYVSRVHEALPASLQDFVFADFEKAYQKMVAMAEKVEGQKQGEAVPPEALTAWEGVDDRLEDIIYSCRLNSFKALSEEYQRRLRKVKERQFLGSFLQDHPGIEHKGGVPFGGTFVVVYHGAPEKRLVTKPSVIKTLARAGTTVSQREEMRITAALEKISGNESLIANDDVRSLVRIFADRLPFAERFRQRAVPEKVIDAAVAEMEDGTVVADFYLPYLCCSDCPPVLFVLPRALPTFSMTIGCTGEAGAEVKITPSGGVSPYSLRVDDGGYEPLSETPLLLAQGEHTVLLKDAEGTESEPQRAHVPAQLALQEVSSTCQGVESYVSVMKVTGGFPPYSVGEKRVAEQFTTPTIPNGTSSTVQVTDQKGCRASVTVMHVCEPPCDLPCGGDSLRCAYRLWVQPPPTEQKFYLRYDVNRCTLRFNGKEFDVDPAVLAMDPQQMNTAFPDAIGALLERLNRAVRHILEGAGFEKNFLIFSFEPDERAPFAILSIEHFSCDTFTLSFDFSIFTRADQVFTYRAIYSNEEFHGVTMLHPDSDRPFLVPAFDCRQRNLCTETEFKPLCDGVEVVPVPGIFPRTEPGTFDLAGNVREPAPEIIAWVWDVFQAVSNEPFYVGQKVRINVRQPGGRVRLTAITDKGCFGFEDTGF